MGRLTLSLFLIVAYLSTSSALLSLLMDSSYCVHLKCEWRGSGCEPSSQFNRFYQRKTVPDSQLAPYDFEDDFESEAVILARIRKMYPMNTFNVVHDSPLDEKCKARRLWCNDKMWYVGYDYNDLIKSYKLQPKFQC
ncbi:unnamed protein product [Caenorhabditis nigoni]